MNYPPSGIHSSADVFRCKRNRKAVIQRLSSDTKSYSARVIATKSYSARKEACIQLVFRGEYDFVEKSLDEYDLDVWAEEADATYRCEERH